MKSLILLGDGVFLTKQSTSVMRRWPVAGIAIACLLLTRMLMVPAHAEVLVYPKRAHAGHPQVDYPVDLLRLALKKAGSPATLSPSALVIPQSRALRELAAGQGVDVMWSVTTREREHDLLPVRVPIYKGLMGWRVALVRADQRELLAKVRTIHDLRRFTAGQVGTWPDSDILIANALNVQTAVSFDSLFAMLRARRYDYCPRSVVEAWREAETFRAQGIVVDEHLLIRYPADSYFFVSRKQPQLARTIERGLMLALADGSFDALFRARFADVLKHLESSNRTVIRLDNPLLPEHTPLNDKRLWYRP
ncbi:ABC transporter substrate-binding protein [Chitinimonas sp. BJYL2]|uniref:substrate-binding periplasmic protein n=1 Tax=Chitinimonas sp. BJYL2 TaxID=2976696 RepID=UPI0022B31B1F|nr:hypothetical protein [Chitinimonas sp. BJYL2]